MAIGKKTKPSDPISYHPSVAKGVQVPPPFRPHAAPTVKTPPSGMPPVPVQPKSVGQKFDPPGPTMTMASAGEILQRKIRFTDNKPFVGDATRPAWTTAFKKSLINRYNQSRPPKEKITEKALTRLQLDRCHRISYKNIQSWLVDYLNDPTTELEFKRRTDELFRDGSSKVKRDKHIEQLKKYANGAQKSGIANQLLSTLHNASGNVNIAALKWNRKLRDNYAPNINKKGQMTPVSAAVTTHLSPSFNMSLLVSPGESRFMTGQGWAERKDQKPAIAKALNTTFFAQSGSDNDDDSD